MLTETLSPARGGTGIVDKGTTDCISHGSPGWGSAATLIGGGRGVSGGYDDDDEGL